jgi:hypothetical protein
MAAIITTKFRIHNAQSFKEGFDEAAASNIYLGIGRPQSWTNDNSPDTPKDTVGDELYYWDDMIALKRVQSSDVSLAIVRRNWTTAKYYDIYRHDYNGTTAGVNINDGGATAPATLADANYYVITDEYNVYKCINNKKNGVVVQSTSKPTGTTPNALIGPLADGYVWKYMFTVSPADVLKFVSTDFVPVKTLLTNPGTTDAYYTQWLAQDAAIDGAIDHIVVNTQGTLYTTAPTVQIVGDGAGATATATIDAGTGKVTAINMTAKGTGYTFATVTLTGGTTGAAATCSAIIAPKGGHGKDPVEELGGFYVMMNVRLEYDDGAGDFPVDNDYRRIMLVRDPFNFNTSVVATTTTMRAMRQLTVTGGSGTFQPDEIITGATSGAAGRIVRIWSESGTNYITYVQTRVENTQGKLFQNGEGIVGGTSTATATLSAISNPEVQADSGDVLYVENRRAINRALDQIEDIKIIVEM